MASTSTRFAAPQSQAKRARRHELTEGVASVVMKDGRFVGNEASDKGIVKFASGSFAALNGKQVKFTSTPISPIRFALELTTE